MPPGFRYVPEFLQEKVTSFSPQYKLRDESPRIPRLQEVRRYEHHPSPYQDIHRVLYLPGCAALATGFGAPSTTNAGISTPTPGL